MELSAHSPLLQLNLSLPASVWTCPEFTGNFARNPQPQYFRAIFGDEPGGPYVFRSIAPDVEDLPRR